MVIKLIYIYCGTIWTSRTYVCIHVIDFEGVIGGFDPVCGHNLNLINCQNMLQLSSYVNYDWIGVTIPLALDHQYVRLYSCVRHFESVLM